MLFSLSGTHCNGKTTIFNELQELPVMEGFTFIGGPTRHLKEKGFAINNDESSNYDDTQLACLEYDLRNILQYKDSKTHVIFERCILDTFVYSKYLFQQGKLSQSVFEKIQEEYFVNRRYFSAFIIPTHSDLVYQKDGVRNEDLQFREDISELFKYEYSNTKFFFIEGSVYVRVGFVVDTIRFLTKDQKIKLDSSYKKIYDTKYSISNRIIRPKPLRFIPGTSIIED